MTRRPSESTVPYADAVWQADAGDRRVLVIDREDTSRQDAVAVLERLGFQVAWAADAGGAGMLFTRLQPHVLVADVETVAPDFEPLRSALEDLFGHNQPVPVVLIGSDKPREAIEWVKAFVPKPLSFGNIEQLVAAVDALAPIADDTDR
ncbi:MAG TPA: response regulator [Polyangiaceae bacterium]|jgi:CheY-like chemotaxis protein|nr:response regulator [Polyangiaceae bacterium]